MTRWRFRFRFPSGKGGGYYSCPTLLMAQEARAWMIGNGYRCDRIRKRP